MAGTLSVQVQYCNGIKHHGLFRQSPYAQLTVGQQQVRTKTAHHGGTEPVFNETFSFELLGENEAEVVLKDHEMIMPDEFLGRGVLPLTAFRGRPNDPMPAAVPLYSKHGTQHGQVHLIVTFTPQYAGAYTPPPAAAGYPAQPAYGMPPQPAAGGNTMVVVDGAMAPPVCYMPPPMMANTMVVVDEQRGMFGPREDVTVVEQRGYGYGMPFGGTTDVFVDEQRGMFGRREDITVVEQRGFGGFGGGGTDVFVDERRGMFGRRDDVTVVEQRGFGGFGGGTDVFVDERRGWL